MTIQGYQFRVGGIPYSMIYDYSVPISDPDNSTEVAKAYNRGESLLLKTICQVNTGSSLLINI